MTKQTNPIQSKIAVMPEGVAPGTPRRRKATVKMPGAAPQTDRMAKPAAGNASSAGKRGLGPADTEASVGERMTKQERVLTLLNRTEGASIDEIMVATGWQQHSVRGFFAGTVKKKLGFSLESNRDGTEARRYRIETTGKKGTAR